MEEKKKDSKFIEESLIRILSTDIPGDMSIYAGLTRIKGVSWSYSNAVCNVLRIDKKKRIFELSEEEMKKISEFIKNPKVPEFVLNRKKDLETGKSGHLTGVDLDLAKEFDIKRMKKIRSYKGIRHILGQPVRGQRTKSHFRKNRAVGVIGKAKKGKKT
jgi:small subunit ribosomal protein S13